MNHNENNDAKRELDDNEELGANNVNDLMVAAEAAASLSLSHLVGDYGSSSEEEEEEQTKEEFEDNAEIDLDGNDSDDSSESDLDLTEELAKMTAEDDVVSDRKLKESYRGPRTINEVEAYGSGCSSSFDFSINITEEQLTRLDKSQLSLAGRVRKHMVADRTVVVESLNGSPPLSEGSVLLLHGQFAGWNTVRSLLLGKIFEVFGPVSQPLYTVRLPPPDESTGNDCWSENGSHTNILALNKSADVHFIKKDAHLLDTKTIRMQSGKGCDASNVYDEEVNIEEVEFSDDEEERRHKLLLKRSKKRSNRTSDGGLAAAALAAGYTIPHIEPQHMYATMSNEDSNPPRYNY